MALGRPVPLRLSGLTSPGANGPRWPEASPPPRIHAARGGIILNALHYLCARNT